MFIHAITVQSFAVADAETMGIRNKVPAPKRSAMFWMVFCFGIIVVAIVAGGVSAVIVDHQNPTIIIILCHRHRRHRTITIQIKDQPLLHHHQQP
jgi:hypothetical protein